MAHKLSKTLKDIYEEEKNRVVESFSKKPTKKLISIRKAYKRSKFTLNDYVTLDFSHRREIFKQIREINDYRLDLSRIRPLNYLMPASPGAGKSHFVKCLAKHKRFNGLCEDVTYNMTNFQSVDDLLYPLEAVRNLKVKDKLPILFLDEIDSNNSHFASLLPLLWDGEMFVGGRNINIGKVVIIMAISDERKIQDKSITKLDDFLSRINGGFIRLPPLDPTNEHDGRFADKICIALSLLERRYGRNLKYAPWNIISFIGKTEFKYGVRSIAYIIDQFSDMDEYGKLNKPPSFLNFLSDRQKLKETGFWYHIDGRKIDTIRKMWDSVKEINISVNFKPSLDEEV